MPGAAYLYCVVQRGHKPPVSRVPAGVPQAARVEVVDIGASQWLVVSEVPLEIYGPDRLESSLRDLDWVSRAAVAHEAVVEHFARQRGSTVVPMKLFTMFTSIARAAAEMRARRRAIAGVFKRVSGCEEWGVRVMRGSPPRPASPASPLPRSGVAFLAARKRSMDEAKQAAARAADAAEAAFHHLSPLARDVRRRDDAPPGAAPPLLESAFLVPRTRRAKFQEAARTTARACARAGAEMIVTGPWPPYNFVQTGDVG